MKQLLAASLVLATLLVSSAVAIDTNDWKTRTIYQLLTDRFARGNGDTSACKDIRNYCGGTWQGITNHLDYIQGLGIDAVWISPVIDNTPGGFHGYWARDWTKLNVHFGDSDTLQNLVHAIHQRGMLAMVGVVANHVGPVGYNYSTIYPFNKAEHYHNCANCPSDCTIQDFGNQPQVELCRLSALPDLNQTNPFVRSYLKKWVVELVKVYGLDGIRIDTCPEVAKSFWLEYTAASGVFELGEVYDARIDYVSSYQGPVVSVLSYPLFFTMRNVFAQKQSMFQLQSTLQQYSQNFRDVTVLGTFLDNHDQPRFLSVNKDWISYKAALTFTVMTTGIPIIYYGTEQGFNGGSDPFNREPLWPSAFSTKSDLYQHIKTIVNFRKSNKLWELDQIQRYADDQFYAFTRGNIFVAITNVGSNSPQVIRTITYHPYTNGQKLCNIFYPTEDCVTVQNNQLVIYLDDGESKIYVLTA